MKLNLSIRNSIKLEKPIIEIDPFADGALDLIEGEIRTRVADKQLNSYSPKAKLSMNGVTLTLNYELDVDSISTSQAATQSIHLDLPNGERREIAPGSNLAEHFLKALQDAHDESRLKVRRGYYVVHDERGEHLIKDEYRGYFILPYSGFFTLPCGNTYSRVKNAELVDSSGRLVTIELAEPLELKAALSKVRSIIDDIFVQLELT